jgi:hypothetical protein
VRPRNDWPASSVGSSRIAFFCRQHEAYRAAGECVIRIFRERCAELRLRAFEVTWSGHVQEVIDRSLFQMSCVSFHAPSG